MIGISTRSRNYTQNNDLQLLAIPSKWANCSVSTENTTFIDWLHSYRIDFDTLVRVPNTCKLSMKLAELFVVVRRIDEKLL